MKRVLFFIDSLTGGGAEKVLTDIVGNLDKEKYEITVLTYWDRGVYVDDIKNNNSIKYRTCFKTLKPGRNLLRKIFNLIAIKIRENIAKLFPKQFYNKIIKDDYDIEIAFLEGITTKVISNSTNYKSRKYAWVHIDLEKKNYVSNVYRNKNEQIKCYKKFDNIFCVSEEVKNSFTRIFGINEKVSTLYNPIDEKKIQALSKEEVDDIELNTKFKIITVGRLEPQKGYDRLLNVHKKLIIEGFDYELWILGEGKDKLVYKEFIEKNSLNDTVKLIGFKKNPYKYMKNSDLFVCSSRTEGFSLVIAEALVLGIPIISTKCSGPNELLNYGEYGLLVENDDEQLYRGIKEILSADNLHKIYKEKAKIRGNIFNMIDKIKEIEQYL